MTRLLLQDAPARKVGEILIAAGLIDEKQLEIALAEQENSGARLGSFLTELGFASEAEVSRALAAQSGIDHSDLDKLAPSAAALAVVPHALATRLSVLPFSVDSGVLLVAMWNPTDIVAIDELQRRSGLLIRVTSAGFRQLQRAIDRAYGGQRAQLSSLELAMERALEEMRDGASSEPQGGMVALVDELVSLALRQDATDLHLQPDARVSRVRVRVDGDLLQAADLDLNLHPAVVSRIKLMSKLETIGQAILAFNLDTARWPVNGDNNVNDACELSRRVGLPTADVTAANIPNGTGATRAGNWDGGGSGGTAGSFEDQLIRNRNATINPLYAVSATTPEPPGWNGPYLKRIPLDPWGRP